MADSGCLIRGQVKLPPILPEGDGRRRFFSIEALDSPMLSKPAKEGRRGRTPKYQLCLRHRLIRTKRTDLFVLTEARKVEAVGYAGTSVHQRFTVTESVAARTVRLDDTIFCGENRGAVRFHPFAVPHRAIL
jgi:hypothetical protein